MRSLSPGLSVLRDAVHVFGSGGVSGVWSGRGRVLRCCGWLLLLRGGSGGGGLYGGGVSGCAGLWDTGGLLRLVGLLGDLSGVLLHLLPLIEQPIREGLQDDVRALTLLPGDRAALLSLFERADVKIFISFLNVSDDKMTHTLGLPVIDMSPFNQDRSGECV